MIATLQDLDIAALVKILKEPKNALVKQYAKLFELEDVELTFTEDALEAIAKKAIKRKTGARGLRSIVEASCSTRCSTCRAWKASTEVVVDKDVVEGRKEPIRVLQEGQGRGGLMPDPRLLAKRCGWRPPRRLVVAAEGSSGS